MNNFAITPYPFGLYSDMTIAITGDENISDYEVRYNESTFDSFIDTAIRAYCPYYQLTHDTYKYLHFTNRPYFAKERKINHKIARPAALSGDTHCMIESSNFDLVVNTPKYSAIKGVINPPIAIKYIKFLADKRNIHLSDCDYTYSIVVEKTKANEIINALTSEFPLYQFKITYCDKIDAYGQSYDLVKYLVSQLYHNRETATHSDDSDPEGYKDRKSTRLNSSH